MKFDKLVNRVLNESVFDLQIPAFDGRREVYGFDSTDAGNGLHRFSDNDITGGWDHWKNIYVLEGEPMDNYGYECTNRDEFLASVQKETDWISAYTGHHMEKAVEEFKRYIPDLLGNVYRHYGNIDHGDFWWGVELDSKYIRLHFTDKIASDLNLPTDTGDL